MHDDLPISPASPVPPHDVGRRRALRTIAAFEALKGVTAAAASVGMLGLLHHDLHHLAEALIGHIGLDPGAHYPLLLLHYVDVLRDANLRSLMAVAAVYVLVRGAEAWGLWFGHSWGEWLGALSGAIYVPFELRHLLHHATVTSAIVLASNVAIVVFLGWQLWRRRHPVA